MSWLAQRWRTQRTAIRSVNCRIQWIIRLLNAKGAVRVSSWRHVCFSVSVLCHIMGLPGHFQGLCNLYWLATAVFIGRRCSVVDFKTGAAGVLLDRNCLVRLLLTGVPRSLWEPNSGSVASSRLMHWDLLAWKEKAGFLWGTFSCTFVKVQRKFPQKAPPPFLFLLWLRVFSAQCGNLGDRVWAANGKSVWTGWSFVY